jgi:CDK inhibitor PHO81
LLTFKTPLTSISKSKLKNHPILSDASKRNSDERLPALHEIFATSFATLEDALAILPNNVHVELHVLYPSKQEERKLNLGPTANINEFADGVLKVVFEHARQKRENQSVGDIGFLRSIVFSSFNGDICTALNWKQPNCEFPNSAG